MKIHELKTWPEYFQAIQDNRKNFELRRDDREFAVGDILILREFDPELGYMDSAPLVAQVSYILKGGSFGLEEGFCIMSIDEPSRFLPTLIQDAIVIALQSAAESD